MNIKILLVVSIILTQSLFSQDYIGFADPFFFGLEPSAKAEAMGKGAVANINNATAQQYNPALISDLNGINVTYSYADPYYSLTKANYNYIGLTYKINNKHSLGLSYNRFSEGEEVKIGSYEYDIPDNWNSNIQATYSYALMADLFLGANLNYFTCHYENVGSGAEDKSDKNFNSLFFDLGIIKKISLNESGQSVQTLVLGASVKNIFNSKIDLAYEEALPSILSIGPAYNFIVNKDDIKLFDIYVDCEYKYVLNSNHYSKLRFGGQFTYYDIISLYLGYYSMEINPIGDNSKDKIDSFTYGFGVNLPFNKLFSETSPITLSINFATLQQPSHVVDRDDWDNFKSLDINIHYNL